MWDPIDNQLDFIYLLIHPLFPEAWEATFTKAVALIKFCRRWHFIDCAGLIGGTWLAPGS